MQGMEIEPAKIREAAKPSEDPKVQAIREHAESKPFSPDPMGDTDRYRLVTPYQLGKD